MKYRDTGGKPARGRSGNAEMRVQALLNKQGVTMVDFFTQHVTEFRSGYISRVQLKASAPDGRPRLTRNLDQADLFPGGEPPMYGQLQLHGLMGGDQVQLQANVTGLDAHRTDVVTVTETVKRLPDFEVRMTAPTQAEANIPVNVVAVVTERNGDLGGSGNCELYAGGQRVDWVWGAWVDAGDAVTCVLTVMFRNPGTYPLEVRFNTWDNNEWDHGNNTDTVTIEVHGESPRFHTVASFEEVTQVDSTWMYSRWQNTVEGWGDEYRYEQFQEHRDQSAYLNAYLPARITGPVNVQASMSTGGRVVDSAQWSSPGPAAGEDFWCTDHWNGPATFWMCTVGGAVTGYTQVSYTFVAGSVTYHGLEYMRMWDDLSGTEWVYHWNNDFTFDDTVPLGDDWTFTVRLNTSAGEHDLSHALPLTRSAPYVYLNPYQCESRDEPAWGYSSTYCYGGSLFLSYLTGYASDWR